MRNLINEYMQPARSADASGGGGATPNSAAAPPPSGGAAPSAEPVANPVPAEPSSAPATPEPYRVDGVDPQLFGETDQATIDNMAKQLKGYRDRDASRQIGETADAYADFSKVDIADDVRGHMDYLSSDPVMKEMTLWAKEQKIPVGDFQAIVAKAHEAAGKVGLFSEMVDETAEQAALVPPEMANASQQQQQQAARQRVDAAENWLKLQAQNGLPQDLIDYGGLMLLDRAQGVQLIEWFKGQMGGNSGPAVLNAGPGAGDTAESLRAELAKPEMQKGHPTFDQDKYYELQGRYKALYSKAT